MEVYQTLNPYDESEFVRPARGTEPRRPKRFRQIIDVNTSYSGVYTLPAVKVEPRRVVKPSVSSKQAALTRPTSAKSRQSRRRKAANSIVSQSRQLQFDYAKELDSRASSRGLESPVSSDFESPVPDLMERQQARAAPEYAGNGSVNHSVEEWLSNQGFLHLHAKLEDIGVQELHHLKELNEDDLEWLTDELQMTKVSKFRFNNAIESLRSDPSIAIPEQTYQNSGYEMDDKTHEISRRIQARTAEYRASRQDDDECEEHVNNFPPPPPPAARLQSKGGSRSPSRARAATPSVPAHRLQPPPPPQFSRSQPACGHKKKPKLTKQERKEIQARLYGNQPKGIYTMATVPVEDSASQSTQPKPPIMVPSASAYEETEEGASIASADSQELKPNPKPRKMSTQSSSQRPATSQSSRVHRKFRYSGPRDVGRPSSQIRSDFRSKGCSFGARPVTFVSNVPGPGAYNLKSTVGDAPKYSLRKRTAPPEVNMNEPGPGSYNPLPKFGSTSRKAEMHKRLDPSDSIDRSQPGPGCYNPQAPLGSKVATGNHTNHWTFTGRSTNEGVNASPGPAAYNLKPFTENQHLAKTMHVSLPNETIATGYEANCASYNATNFNIGVGARKPSLHHKLPDSSNNLTNNNPGPAEYKITSDFGDGRAYTRRGKT